ncbi:MAG: prepilin peptidase [Candidatus Altiarchaeota archaeon]|nr:prepilin peptidase [Candidatus Altiarchaeota archaeon]
MLGVTAAITGTLTAVCFDLRYQRIPNMLLGLMFFFSLPVALLGGNMVPWALNVTLAFILFYAFWALRVWAAGDSKLLIALAALIPQYPETAFLPKPQYSGFFFLTVVMNLLVVYLAYASVLLIVRSPGKAARNITVPLALSAVILCPVPSISRYSSFLFIVLSLYVYHEASRLRLTKRVRITELKIGDNLAERVIEKGGIIMREREERASLTSLLKELFRGETEAVVKPSAAGITEEERGRLVGLVIAGGIGDEIEIYSGTMMSPLILIALLFSVFAGDLFSVIL